MQPVQLPIRAAAGCNSVQLLIVSQVCMMLGVLAQPLTYFMLLVCHRSLLPAMSCSTMYGC
jgi:TRAP-type C4-dicarboxylate transport system permease large subunit